MSSNHQRFLKPRRDTNIQNSQPETYIHYLGPNLIHISNIWLPTWYKYPISGSYNQIHISFIRLPTRYIYPISGSLTWYIYPISDSKPDTYIQYQTPNQIHMSNIRLQTWYIYPFSDSQPDTYIQYQAPNLINISFIRLPTRYIYPISGS